VVWLDVVYFRGKTYDRWGDFSDTSEIIKAIEKHALNSDKTNISATSLIAFETIKRAID
jgi:cytochrome c-type biogenesis protein CcmH/NrfG